MSVRKILFYSIIPFTSKDQLTLMKEFKRKGFQVYFLNKVRSENFREELNVLNIPYFEYENTFLSSFLFFVKFCFDHNFNYIYAHLEPANFIAVLGQFFITGKVLICRHHIDEAKLYNFQQSLSYKLTYRLAKKIVVVSAKAKEYMIEEEKVPPYKIHHINLAYDFSLFNKVERANANELRSKYSCNLLLLTVCRLTKYKRPEIALKTLERIVKSGLNAKLIVLGKGELYNNLIQTVKELNLEEHVFILGYVNNPLDYLLAADYLLHPSLLESSCVVVKEAAIMEKPVVVCSGIGDFDDYIQHNVNGIKVDPNKFVDESAKAILEAQKNNTTHEYLGYQLRKDVIRLFSFQNVVDKYDDLIR